MPLPPIELATVEELRLIAATAIRAVGDHFDPDDDDDDFGDENGWERRYERIQAAVGAARFCASVAEHQGALELCPLLVDFLDRFVHLEDVANDDIHGIARVVQRFLQRGAPITEGVRSLAKSGDARLRLYVARGIRPDDDLEVAILMELAGDAVPEVRDAARSSLGTRASLPWWHGKLSRDPTEGMTPEEQATHADAIRRIAEILDMPSHQSASFDAELARIAATLPDALAIDVAESVLRQKRAYDGRDLGLPALMLSRRGGVDAVLRVIRRLSSDSWSSTEGTKALSDALVTLAPDKRCEIVSALVAFALGGTSTQRADILRAHRLAAEIAARGWIAGDDTEPLLDTILALDPPPAGETDRVVDALSPIFSHPPVEPARMFQRALAARLEGFRGRYAPLWIPLGSLLSHAPRELIRDAAFGALHHEDDGVARWAVEQVLGRAHDPAHDPPLRDQTLALLDSPRHRAVVCSSEALRMLAFPELRRALRSGGLTLGESADVMQAIGSLWGGLAESLFLQRPHSRSEDESQQASQRRKYAAFLGPPDVHGPPTEAEWSALRAARLRDPGAHMRDLIRPLPEGPSWHPDDAAAMRRAIQIAEPDDPDALLGGDVFSLALDLASKVSPETLRLVDELEARFPRHRHARACRARIAKALGVAVDGPGASEWMDEPEED